MSSLANSLKFTVHAADTCLHRKIAVALAATGRNCMGHDGHTRFSIDRAPACRSAASRADLLAAVRMRLSSGFYERAEVIDAVARALVRSGDL